MIETTFISHRDFFGKYDGANASSVIGELNNMIQEYIDTRPGLPTFVLGR